MSKLAYFEWCADPSVDPDDPEAWAAANPALGIRISEDFIETERGALPDEDFIRERLGIFPEELDATDPALDPDAWRACVAVEPNGDPRSHPLDPVVLAFEVSPDRKSAVIATAGISDQGGIHVEVIDKRRRTGWVVDRLAGLSERHEPSAIVCHKGGPAGSLLADCEAEGLEVTPASSQMLAQACEAAHDDVTEKRWRHLDQPDLNAAVTGATWRETGDAKVFDRRTNLDISPLIAVTLAAWLVRRPDDSSVYEERGLVTL